MKLILFIANLARSLQPDRWWTWGGWTLAAVLLTTRSPAEPVSVKADFDRGSIGTLREVAPGVLRGQTRHWKQPDGQNDQRYWFYCQLTGVAGRTITIELTDMIGVYRGRPHRGIIDDATRPVVSYDGVNWHRMQEGRINEDGVWTLRHAFTKSPAWIAYAHPYPLERLERWAAGVAQQPGVRRQPLGRSTDGRPLWLIQIGPAEPKKVVLITSLIHPGEDAAGFVAEGLVSFLLGNDTAARTLRRDVLFCLIPSLNPDGLFRGHARLNARLQDLNAVWDDSAGANSEPEVAAVLSWMNDWRKSDRTFDVHLDLHAAGQRRTSYALVTTDPWLRGAFGELLNRQFPTKPVNSHFARSIAGYTQSRFGTHAATFEVTQSRLDAGPYLDIPDYHATGATLAKSLHRLFQLRDEQ